jgi:hypothetical protein
MMQRSVSLTEGLREMVASGRLTQAMIPDDFQWLEAALGFAEQPSPPAPIVITESSLKKNFNDPPVTPRPPAPRSQVASLDCSIDDLLGEALRRHRHGLIRPLWADMPEGEEKQRWRLAGRALLDFSEAYKQAKPQSSSTREAESEQPPAPYFVPAVEEYGLREKITDAIRSNSSPTVETKGFHARNGRQAGYIVYEHDGLPGVVSEILDLFGLVDHSIATMPLNEPVLVFDEGTGDAAIIELRRPGEFRPFGNPRDPRPATHWRRLPPKGKRP